MKYKNVFDISKKISMVLIALYLFLLSINIMGAAFELFGKDLATTLMAITANPFMALFIGILVTSIIQSSSVVTSIIVGLVASNAMSLGSAIPLVMGANIGTTVTSTIVSLGHIRKKEEFINALEASLIHDLFNIITVMILFPIEVHFHILEKIASKLTTLIFGASTVTFTSPLKYILNPVTNFVSAVFGNNAYILVGVAIAVLFYSLKKFVDFAKPIASSEFGAKVKHHIFKSPARSFAFGLLLTAFVQSSSVTTSLIVPLAAIGYLTLEEIFPYTMGANIGTTITAILASLATNSAPAVAVAITHLCFNLFGAVFIYPFRKIPIIISRSIASLAFKSRAYPIIYVASVFYAVPVIIILILR